MSAVIKLRDVDDINLIQKRFELMAVARYRDKARIKTAMEVQDTLRKRSKGWDSAKQIRKWRDNSYGLWFLILLLL